MTFSVDIAEQTPGGIEFMDTLPPVADLEDAKAAALDAGWFVTGAWIEENRVIVTADGLDIETDHFGTPEGL